MIERIIIIDTVDPQTFYGPNNANMSLIRNLYPKLRVSARGNVIKVLGEEGETQQFEKKIRELEAWATKYNKLTEENFRGIAAIMLGELRDVMKEKNIALTWDDSLVDYLVGKAYSVTYGARNLRRTIQKDIEDVLAQRIVENRGREIKSIAMSAQDGAVTIAIGE